MVTVLEKGEILMEKMVGHSRIGALDIHHHVDFRDHFIQRKCATRLKENLVEMTCKYGEKRRCFDLEERFPSGHLDKRHLQTKRLIDDSIDGHRSAFGNAGLTSITIKATEGATGETNKRHGESLVKRFSLNGIKNRIHTKHRREDL